MRCQSLVGKKNKTSIDNFISICYNIVMNQPDRQIDLDNLIAKTFGVVSERLPIKCLEPHHAILVTNHSTHEQRLVFSPVAQSMMLNCPTPNPDLELVEIDVPCGKCFFCQIQKMRSKSLQLIHEAKSASSTIFVTLTYSNDGLKRSWEETNSFYQKKIDRIDEKLSEYTIYDLRKGQSLDEFMDYSTEFTDAIYKHSLETRRQDLEKEKQALIEKQDRLYNLDFAGRRLSPKYNALHYRDIQLFMKRLRRYDEYHNSNKSIRFYAGGEHGTKKGRPHWHMILYNLSPALLADLKWRSVSVKNKELYKSKILQDLWSYGFVDCSKDLKDDAMFYTVGYTLKKQEHAMGDEVGHGSARLGWSHISKYIDSVINQGFVVQSGKRYSIPASYLRLYINREVASIFSQFSEISVEERLAIRRMVCYNISMRKRHNRSKYQVSLKSRRGLLEEAKYAKSKLTRDGLLEGPTRFVDLRVM